MLTYNYKCEDRGAEFEIKATLEEKEKENIEKFKCLSCGSIKIKQQITGANFISKSDSHGGCAGGCCGGMCG
jgi:predicted nucleic acid-binding Zn ribbon protein